MKFILFIFLFTIVTINKIQAQQNLFNIPSGDITPKGKLFYQHQINTYRNKFESKGHFVYGLGKGWDVGANLVGTGAKFNPSWKTIYNSDFSGGQGGARQSQVRRLEMRAVFKRVGSTLQLYLHLTPITAIGLRYPVLFRFPKPVLSQLLIPVQTVADPRPVADAHTYSEC